MVVGFPAPIALAGIAFGEYFKIFTPGISPVLISLLVIWIITLVHLFGLRVEEMFQNASTFCDQSRLRHVRLLGVERCNVYHR